MVSKKVKKAITNATAILPVTLNPPKKGIRPNMLPIHMKKKMVSKNGKNFLYFLPIDGFAISSETNKINGSNKDCIPFGALPSRLL